MVEKIEVSRDEVLHYSWIDHTWVYVYYTKNSITRDPIFSQLLERFIKRGIKEVIGQEFKNIIMQDGYVFIQYDTDEIVEILKKASLWFLNSNIYAKNPESPLGKFFVENKNIFYTFFEETKNILEEKKYKYYFQRVDGMN